MPFIKTEFPGLLVFEPNMFEDSRGYFFEAYNEKQFQQEGIDIRWVQDNQSSSSYGVIRCSSGYKKRLSNIWKKFFKSAFSKE